MAIDNVRLPVDVERGAQGGPGFKTTVISLASGDEQRNQEWSRSRGKWNIGYGIQKRADFEAVYAFFHARAGMARGFRFRDWLDYRVEYGVVGSVAGDTTKRQLVRVYADLVNPYVRNIVLPVTDTVKVYVGSVLTTDYTLLSNGVLDFLTDPGPTVVASFEYDVPARFDTDDLNVDLKTYLVGSIPSIPIVELRNT